MAGRGVFLDNVQITAVPPAGNPSVIPEPSTYSLLGAGLLALGGAARRRRAHA